MLAEADDIRVANSGQNVFKEECVVSFDNPETEGGLYVCLRTFQGIGQRNLSNFVKICDKSKFFLNIRRTRLPKEKIEESTPTKLAIGVPGGFPVESDLFDIDEKYQLAYFTNDGQLVYNDDFEKLPKELLQSINSVLDAPACLVRMPNSLTSNVGWDGEARLESKFSNDLKQIGERKIPPFGWKCDNCELTNNLWLNLTDGAILCGRKYHDGTGGNNHALEHYNKTNYPLAVKLGTIGQGSNPDVYSYPEDNLVIDSCIEKHLEYFGIYTSTMKKSEKSLLEMEIDLNRKIDEKWESERILETNRKLVLLKGPSFTPMINIGSSCYLNSVIQILFSTKAFQEFYYDNYSNILNDCLRSDSIVNNLTMQFAKIADGLLSGRYEMGIRPYMLKHVLCKKHNEFSTMRQQDAMEFLLFCFQEIQRSLHSSNTIDPSDQFRFLIECRSEYVNCRKCHYNEYSECAIQLPINVDQFVLNKQELNDYKSKCQEMKSQGLDTSKIDVVEPLINFMDCLKDWSKDETIENVLVPGSSDNHCKDTLLKTLRFKTFPEYLVFSVQRFTLNKNWVPCKLHVQLCVPDEIDLTHLKAKGPQSDETLIDRDFGLTDIQQSIVLEMTELGFSREACCYAVSKTSSKEEAVELLLSKGDSLTSAVYENTTFKANQNDVETLTAMGFNEDIVHKALFNTDGDVTRAVDWLFNHMDDCIPQPSNQNESTGKYHLWAFISHIGNNTSCGHYVAHIRKDTPEGLKWVIYDDERIAISEKPPKEYGYMYFYKREQDV